LSQFVEQPHILDGSDDGLRGEVLDQIDLFIGRLPDGSMRAAHRDSAMIEAAAAPGFIRVASVK
jgi:hypothetical protein